MAIAILRCAVLLAAAIALQACSGKPGESQGRQVFESYLHQQFGSAPIVIDSFTKTNGQDANFAGVEQYVLYYEASATLPEGNRPGCLPHGQTFTGLNCWMANIGSFPPEPQGTHLAFKGTMLFNKSEKGWLGGVMDTNWHILDTPS